MQHRITAFVSTLILAACGSLSSYGAGLSAPEDQSKADIYTARVKPIFAANCGRCHSGMNHRGGLNMDTREALLKGGHTGPAIVPGDPTKSLLVIVIRHQRPGNDPKNMPPNKPQLSESDIHAVEMWIKAGAPMPSPTR